MTKTDVLFSKYFYLNQKEGISSNVDRAFIRGRMCEFIGKVVEGDDPTG